jgi:hypothetical protein
MNWILAKIFIAYCILAARVDACGEPLKRICYYTTGGGVMPNPPDLCTHIIYAFAGVESGVLSNVWSNPLKEIRKTNPDIKIMVAVGGWTFGVQKMTELLKDESSRFKFVNSSVDFLRKFDFDGLDLDFECNLSVLIALLLIYLILKLLCRSWS